MSRGVHQIATFDELVQLLDDLDGDHVVVEACVESSMCGLDGVAAKGILRRHRGGDDGPNLARNLRYDLYHSGRGIGNFTVDELFFTAAELLVFDTGQDPPRLFITQDVWRWGEEGELPPHRLQLIVWLEDRLTFELPAHDENMSPHEVWTEAWAQRCADELGRNTERSS